MWFPIPSLWNSHPVSKNIKINGNLRYTNTLTCSSLSHEVLSGYNKYRNKFAPNTLNRTAVPAPDAASNPTARKACDQWKLDCSKVGTEEAPLEGTAAGRGVWVGGWSCELVVDFNWPSTSETRQWYMHSRLKRYKKKKKKAKETKPWQPNLVLRCLGELTQKLTSFFFVVDNWRLQYQSYTESIIGMFSIQDPLDPIFNKKTLTLKFQHRGKHVGKMTKLSILRSKAELCWV